MVRKKYSFQNHQGCLLCFKYAFHYYTSYTIQKTKHWIASGPDFLRYVPSIAWWVFSFVPYGKW